MPARRPALLALIIAACGAAAARAGDLEVVVRDGRGAPLSDVVVTAAPARGGKAPARYGQPLDMLQEHYQFSPFILVVPKGAVVRFPNHDPVHHQVYSFSPAKPFDLKLYGGRDVPSERFDKTGVVALGCNIHDAMVAYIDVVDTPFAAKTDAGGRVVFHGVPAGPAEVRAWHPYMRAPGSAETTRVAVAADGATRIGVTAELRSTPHRTAPL